MITNLTRNNRLYRPHTRVGVSYDSDLDLARKTIENSIDKLEWRSKVEDPELYLDELGDSSINYGVNVWIDDANDARGRKSDLLEAIWRALKDGGITIAYPQLDLHLDKEVTSTITKHQP